MKDLYILVADMNMKYTLSAALNRPIALGTREITFVIGVHPNRDNGIRTTGPQMLSLLRRQYSHGLLVLDYEGSGTNCKNSKR